ncbi:DNA mismatch repair endonuclease MutL [bacterium]|nr:DNA mismatch repair endonuclease MutL [bacterium]
MDTPSVEFSFSRREIRRLPDALINQIAAGEVVERPASVIKELVENSLDAGASSIEIHLKGGGIEEIQVIDNGHGIPVDEFPLAIERHATSKLATLSDLAAIDTFGFRGEALSSICSVADVCLTSRTDDSPSGFQMQIQQGKMAAVPIPVGTPTGTRITVSRLFHQVPARRKFLRSSTTELTHCQRIVKELALGNPGTRLSLKHEGRTLGNWVTEQRIDRFKECLKLSVTPQVLQEVRDHLVLEAFTAPAEETIARAELYLFINGRPVRNRSFLSAIRTAFHEATGGLGEPIGVCYLDIRKDWLDVNVHPQKWEIRCLEQETIYYWLLSCFRKHFAAPPLAKTQPDSPVPFAPVFSPSPAFSSTYPFAFVARSPRFLIVEDAHGLLIINPHHLADLATLRKWQSKAKGGNSDRQTLEIPKIIRLTPAQLELFLPVQDLLSSLGFETQSFGDLDIAVHTRPAFCSEHSVTSLLPKLLQKLQPLANQTPEPRTVNSLFKHLLSSIPAEEREGQELSTHELLEELARAIQYEPEFQKYLKRIPWASLSLGDFQ